jgi:hypothetical protein
MTNPAPTGGDERPDPLTVGEVPPPAVPATPAYDSTELLEPTPAYDSTELLEPTPAYDSLAQETALTAPVDVALTPEVDYALAPDPGASGPLAQVKAFAADKPALFLGLALAAGWLVGKIFSSSDDDSSDDDD